MRRVARLGTLPGAVTILTAFTALYYILVAFGNLTDFGTNLAFVDKVFDMSDTFKDDDLMWRRIENDTIVKAAYIGIIIWEMLIAAVLSTAFVQWVRGNREVGQRLSTLGWVMVVILFGVGFLTIGGEWFSMWQAKVWTGIEPAFRNLVIAALGLILANMPGAAAQPDVEQPRLSTHDQVEVSTTN